MRPLEEIRVRWRATQTHSESLADLQRAVRHNGPSSPCVSGLRSICWKTLLLSNDNETDWIRALHSGRDDYASRQDALLRYIKNPEALTELSVDPLADDPNSPWDAARQDEIIRDEIRQDVQRLPDEANYHHERIQTMILDILFIYCKSNPDRGGYRQGMHELLAPIVHVLEADAIERVAIDESHGLDETLVDLVDSSFIENDAYLLFSRLMDSAQSFYAVNEGNSKPHSGTMATHHQEQTSAIVERSKFIHEVCLQKVDPELASHLISIEILPQIFLIRWVRLLFSREFPFDQLLVLWDTIFAIDPTLELIDMICVAMLIRIRWQLLKADYSVCLQLLLKYPPPDQAHGPHTFVDDALYLRDHLNAQGGSKLIMKYTGKAAAAIRSPHGSRPTTPSFPGLNTLRQRGLGVRSPLHSPPTFINQQAGVEALLQGAAKGAKGMLERGEKLGINQALRDAVGEIRRNMQGFNESGHVPRPPKEILSQEGAVVALAAMERRNQQLASMLDDTVTSLKAISASNLDDKSKGLELIEIAAAKIQFVKIYLEDPTMEVPVVDRPVPEEHHVEADQDSSAGDTRKGAQVEPDVDEAKISSLSLNDDVPAIKTEQPISPPNPQAVDTSGQETTDDAPPAAASKPTRPPAVPTRSTLAQSSFAWMLESDDTSSSPSHSRVTPKSPPGSKTHKKRVSNNASREKNAFLFGEVTTETDGSDPLKMDDIFGMEPLRKKK